MIPSLRISLLGGVSFQLNDKPLVGLTAVKAQALLIYLAVTGKQHSRAALAGLLWSDVLESAASNSLRVTLAQLRQALGDSIDATRQSVALASELPLWLDVTEFAQACNSLQSAAADIAESGFQTLRTAVHLYRGDFVSSFYIPYAELFEEWVTAQRAYYARLALDGLTRLGTLALQRGAPAAGIEDVQRALTLDPLLEEAHQLLMQLYAANGQTTLALRQYEICMRVLKQDLGISPAAETVAIAEAIRTRTLVAPGRPVPAVPSQLAHADNEPSRSPHHDLPLQPTPFIGREQELAALAELMADPQCRLISLLGPGGIGKTRLALEVAHEMGKGFADGATFVSLAPLDAAEFIVPTIAASLDLTLASQAAPSIELLRYLRQKELLLVLDNFEHLLAPSPHGDGSDSAADLLTAILQHAAGVKLLVTSRERLNLQGEWMFDVGGLEPPNGAYRGGEGRTADFERNSAVALFLQATRRVHKAFDPTAADLAAIVRICQLVQGMPLALELAAAWVRVLSCSEIANEIEQSLGFLTTTLRDLPERHRSLQAVFDYSWKLLSVEEQHVFACCSVFRGGFTREAAAAVAGASLPILAALVDKSLLRRNAGARYELHELARQYAAARLAVAQVEVETRNRHLLFYMHFAETAEPNISGGEQPAQWHQKVESEHDNVRAAIDWSLMGGEIEPGLRIVGALWEFWMNRGHAPEGERQAERFLARPEAAAPTLLRARALHTAGVCALYQGRYHAALAKFAEVATLGRDLGASGRFVLALACTGQGFTLINSQEFDAAQPFSEEALRLGKELQIGWVKGDALLQLGRIAWRRGDYEMARQHFFNSLECYQSGGQSYMCGLALTHLGTMHAEQGDYAAATAKNRQSLAIHEEMGDKLRSSAALTRLGRLAMAQGNDQEAQELLSKALRLTRDMGHMLNQIDPLDALGRLAQRQGDYARARTLHEESLALSIDMENRTRIAQALEAFACLAARQGQAEKAARLFGAAEVSYAPTGPQFDPTWQLEHDHLVATMRSQLSENAFDAAWAAGQTMTMDEAVKLTEAQQQN